MAQNHSGISVALYVVALILVFFGIFALKPEWKDFLLPKEPDTQQTSKQNLKEIKERFGSNAPKENKQEKQENSVSDANSKRLPIKKDSSIALTQSRLLPDSLQSAIAIQYPDGNRQALYQFFKSLERLENGEKQLYRVLHYGDSQLEGDRISYTLRKNLQERFGGCGAGLQGATNYTNVKFSVLQENDSRWKNYFVLGRNKANFGVLSYCFQLDSLAEVLFRKSDKASALHQRVENVKVFFRNPLSLRLEEKNVFQEKTFESQEVSVASFNLSEPFEELKIQFRGNSKTEVYGISLDCHKGIAVDNIPIRGSAGLEFRKMNVAYLQKQMKNLQVSLVILQFGVNVTMNSKDYSFYERKFVEEVLFLKKCIPNASFLLIGISDRSYKTLNGYASYPAVVLLRDTQKRIAAQTGCAFWDLYEAMGGKNSMPQWVAEDLASKDFIHFKPKGAELVGNMLAEALLQEYNKFKGFSP